jgi:hypothetical protein
MKVEKDITLSVDFLSRGVPNLSNLTNDLQVVTLTHCQAFEKLLCDAYVKCLKAYHISWCFSTNTWSNDWFGIKLPNIATYLDGNTLTKPDNEQKCTEFKNHTTSLISDFSTSMKRYHKHEIELSAKAAYEAMMTYFHDIQSLVLNTDFCDKHQLDSVDMKEGTLLAIQQA